MTRSTRTPRFILGITPSALALYNAQEPAKSCLWDMPTDHLGIIPGKLGQILEEVILETTPDDGEFLAIIRTPGARDYDAGVVDGVLAGMDIPYSFRHQPEAQGEAEAAMMFPSLAHMLEGPKAAGRLEALMLAAQGAK